MFRKAERKAERRKEMISKRLVVFLGVLAFVFAACSSSVVEPTPSQTANPKGHVSGVLRTPGPDPLTLDPAMVTDAGSHLYVAQIFDGLLTMALDKDGKLIYVPDIAESIPEPVTNQDGILSAISGTYINLPSLS